MKTGTLAIAAASLLAFPVWADSAYPLHEQDMKYTWQWKSEFAEQQQSQIKQANNSAQTRERETAQSEIKQLVDDANDLGW